MNTPAGILVPCAYPQQLAQQVMAVPDSRRAHPGLTIVIPVHNEEANIIPLLVEIRQYLDGKYDYEVIVVDDHSTDNTELLLRKSVDEYPVLRIIRLMRRGGQSGAVLQGVRAAGYPLIVTLDGDGQNDPADIDALVACYRQTSSRTPRCLIIGNRYRRRDSMWKKFSSKIANSVRGSILRDKTPDSGCGIKAFPRDFFLEFPAFDHMHRFLPALACQRGGTVVSLDVHHRPRKSGASHYGSLDRLMEGIIDLLGVVWLGYRRIDNEAVK
ncbi:glycosyltransferase family 2 protein [Desulfoprunum benzoelyticum]|nr:glycosyltransferase family 2 protein [Desulfoprunum benzoelyticum]MBM9530483.1 glycosyltransferase family 2 protein [Desulfoprunum benzoelyticum]